MLKDKTILITGGGSGIGAALAIALSNSNRVIVCGRNEEKLKNTAAAGKQVLYYTADISVPGQIDGLFQKIAAEGHVPDVLINNAGVAEQWDIPHTAFSSAEIFEKINTNLSGAIAITQHFIRQADAGKENTIINITSEIAYFPVPLLALYAASKAGLSVFTRALRQLLKNTGFKVVEILPPAIDTPMSRGLGNTRKHPSPSDFAKKVIEAVNRGRLEYAPGSNVPLLKFFGRFLPKTGIKLVDKMSRKQLKGR